MKKNNFRYKADKIISCKKFLDIPNLSEKYIKLIQGLDENSVDCVAQILSRMKLISQQELSSNPEAWRSIDIYSQSEIEAFEKLRKEYAQKIIQFSDGCFAYKHYLLPIKHFESSVFYYKHQIPNLNNLSKLRNKDFIDAGGFIGDSAIVLSEFTTGNVYSFEAVTKHYKNMLRTIELNKRKNIIPVNMALGSSNEELEVRVRNSGSTMTPNSPGGFKDDDIIEKTTVTTLDSFVNKYKLDVGLIKVDIEGFEQEFLKGAKQTIRKYKPTMILSIYHSPYDFFDIKPIIESWDL